MRSDFETELEFAFRDAGNIEQVVDQARLQFDISPDDGERMTHIGIVRRTASSSPTIAMTGESGLRNSCESRARN